MRKPKQPPDYSGVLEKALEDRTRFGQIVAYLSSDSLEGDYFHWDELIYHQPPKDLTHEEWWLVLRMRRRSQFKEVPLRDKQGQPFVYLEPDPIPERLHFIDTNCAGRIQMPEQITNPETRDQYYVGSLIEEAITSSQLEGATTTRMVAKEMIRSGRSPRDKSERMILNNFVTMREIGNLKDEPLTEDLIFRIHRLVTNETLDHPSEAGRFRKAEEPISVMDTDNQVFHVPPVAGELAERLAALVDFANAKSPSRFIHPAIRSIILHFWLAYDHPFVDGNGRTARALFYWSMLHHGFWIFEFISISKIILKAPAKYSRAFLYTETDANDLTYFILYHIEVIRRAVNETLEYIKKKTREIQAVEARLRGAATLNHRQRALISHALRHPGFHYNIETHQLSHNVVYQTARSDLLDLSRRGLMRSRKVGRRFYFDPVPDLEDRLAKVP
jgi:Fic family protein